MKKTVRLVGLVLAVLLAFCLAPKFPVSADYGDYDSHDIEIINELIRDNNFGFDSWIVWESGISEPPTGWPERVEWNEGTPKKIITIKINGLNSYGSGQVDLSGLKELQGIDIHQTRIGALAVTGLNALQSLTGVC